MGFWFMRCDEVSRRVSDGMERKLGFSERIGVLFHLMMCRYCLRFFRQIRAMRRLIRSTSPDHLGSGSLDQTARKRIQESVQAELDRRQK